MPTKTGITAITLLVGSGSMYSGGAVTAGTVLFSTALAGDTWVVSVFVAGADTSVMIGSGALTIGGRLLANGCRSDVADGKLVPGITASLGDDVVADCCACAEAMCWTSGDSVDVVTFRSSAFVRDTASPSFAHPAANSTMAAVVAIIKARMSQ